MLTQISCLVLMVKIYSYFDLRAGHGPTDTFKDKCFGFRRPQIIPDISNQNSKFIVLRSLYFSYTLDYRKSAKLCFKFENVVINFDLLG